MVLNEARTHAVDGIDGAALELVDVASDHFRSLLDVWDYKGDLELVGELPQTLEDAVAHLKVAV